MKLLMISGHRPMAVGKKESFYYTLEEFSKYWERIDIICPRIETDRRGSARELTQGVFDNVIIHTSIWPLIFQPFFILKKGRELYQKEKYDLITVQEYPPFYNGLGARWLAKKINVPYILEFHHIPGYPKAANSKEIFYRVLCYFLASWDTKPTLAVRVVNQHQVPDFLEKAGVAEEKIKYIPSFYIDFDVFFPKKIEKTYDLCFCGRLVKNKGIFNLIEAVQIVQKKYPEIRFVIIGSGPLEKKIKRIIKEKKLEKNIILTGWLPEASDLARIYNQSKIFILSSFNEGGPRVALEAMACGVPIISTRVGIMNDLIKDKENGLFADWQAKDMANKIFLLLFDKNLCEKIGKTGQEIVQRFERKEMIKNYALIYQNLIK